MSRFESQFRAGQWVEVRSPAEILATLDGEGALEALPFMPEMLQHCGRRYRVFKSAHKTCDTIHQTKGRRLKDAVHLDELRCDGSAHGGCQADCLLFWKDAWLKPADGPARGELPAPPTARDLDDRLARAASRPGEGGEPVYSCQTTRLYDATSPLPPWNPLQYVADIRSGNEGLAEALKVMVLNFLFSLRDLPAGYRFFCWLYDRAHRLIRGTDSPYGWGTIPRDAPTPHGVLDLQPGEWVEVKSREEVLATLNVQNRNRGMYWDKEMIRYCGQRFRVKARVSRILDEQSGRMIHIRTPAVSLEGTYCTSRYSEGRLLCPRRIVPYWREIWLKRVPPPAAGSAAGAGSPAPVQS